MRRFKDTHMGTDKKITLKDPKYTPGPGHYHRVDEQYSRTFHHATKNQHPRSSSIHGSNGSPTATNYAFTFTGAGQTPTDLQVVKGFTEMGEIGNGGGLHEPPLTSNNAAAARTSKSFFGRAGSSASFLDTLLGNS